QENWLLEAYFEKPVTDELYIRYSAMKCASLLREAMWSMVSEIHSPLDFDFVAYTLENLNRFEQAWNQIEY
ncbi:MAG: choline kinase, partial [Deltaproteobacteria bacterium]|nr:choline kinase [Deltaproteobacteria bacterium]